MGTVTTSKMGVALALVATLAMSGCCKKNSSSSTSSSSGSNASGDTGETVTMPKAKVQFDAPGGWKKTTSDDGWTIFMPGDKFANLAFVTFDKPNESTRRIGQMSARLGVDIDWSAAGSRHSSNVGKGAYPSQWGETNACKLHGGDPCYMWYATVNPGTTDQVLIVYTVNTAKGSAHKANAKAAVDSLRAL